MGFTPACSLVPVRNSMNASEFAGSDARRVFGDFYSQGPQWPNQGRLVRVKHTIMFWV